MRPLTRADLMTLEAYAARRDAYRAEVIAHKQARSIALGPNLTLLFEDRVTVQYQVQEMLRIERIFEAGPIEEELAAYNPLIPDGSNLKATLLIEFPDPEERRAALMRLKDVEHDLALEVAGARFPAIADEDLDRSDAEKTSAVHFLRFELTPQARAALKDGAALVVACEHPEYRHRVEVVAASRRALAADLD